MESKRTEIKVIDNNFKKKRLSKRGEFYMKNVLYSFLLFVILGQISLFADSPCKDLSKDQCEANSDCTWVSGYKKKDGTTVNPYCRAKPGKANNTEDKETKKDKKKEKDLDKEDKESKKDKKKKKDLDKEDKEAKKDKKKEKDLDKEDKEAKKDKKKKEKDKKEQ